MAFGITSNIRAVAKAIRRDLEKETRDLGTASVAGMKRGAAALKTDLRSQTLAAGFPAKMAKTWRDRTFPNKRINAAAMVWSKAPRIMRAAAEGAVIRPSRGRFLILPTEVAVRMGFAKGPRVGPSGTKTASFANVEKARRRFGKLRVVPQAGNSGQFLLVADAVRRVAGGRILKARSRKTKSGRRRFSQEPETVALFTLVPRVVAKRRINADRAARRALDVALGGLDSSLQRSR